jgi:hypothetical protein
MLIHSDHLLQALGLAASMVASSVSIEPHGGFATILKRQSLDLPA